jgi:hypothetical protein
MPGAGGHTCVMSALTTERPPTWISTGASSTLLASSSTCARPRAPLGPTAQRRVPQKDLETSHRGRLLYAVETC